MNLFLVDASPFASYLILTKLADSRHFGMHSSLSHVFMTLNLSRTVALLLGSMTGHWAQATLCSKVAFIAIGNAANCDELLHESDGFNYN